MSDKVYDLKGTTIAGKVRVVIRPGFGIRLPNPAHDPEQPEKGDGPFRHFGYEDGAVDVPVAIASDMLHDGRAFLADENDEAVDSDGESVNTEAAAEAVAAVDTASPVEAK
jgi:hypothetical protein